MEGVSKNEFNCHLKDNQETNIKFIKFMEEFKTHIEYIKKSLNDNNDQHKEIIKKIDDWIEEANKKYSGKWVEKLLVWIGRIIGIAVIGGLLGLIANVFIHLSK